MEETPQQSPKTPTWLYVLFGCLGVFIIAILIVAGFVWYAARKVRDAVPALEQQFQSDLQKELDSGDIQDLQDLQNALTNPSPTEEPVSD